MGEVEIVVKVPEGVPKEVVERIVEREVERLRIRKMIEEILKNSELTEEDAIELGRIAKKGRGKVLDTLLDTGH